MNRARFERAVNVALIVAAAVFVATQIRAWRTPSPSSAHSSGPQYAEGDLLSELPAELGRDAKQKSILVFVNSACRFCTDNMPFYSRLAAALKKLDRADDFRIRLAVISREPVETTARYLGEYGVQASTVLQIPAPMLPRLRLTPTLLLLDSAGRVERVWTGVLDPAEQDEVFSALQ